MLRFSESPVNWVIGDSILHILDIRLWALGSIFKYYGKYWVFLLAKNWPSYGM